MPIIVKYEGVSLNVKANKKNMEKDRAINLRSWQMALLLIKQQTWVLKDQEKLSYDLGACYLVHFLFKTKIGVCNLSKLIAIYFSVTIFVFAIFKCFWGDGQIILVSPAANCNDFHWLQ